MVSLNRSGAIHQVLLWSARFAAAVSFAMLTIFVVAHLNEDAPGPVGSEWLGLMCFPCGVMVGLLLALRYPIAGGGLVVFSLACFYLWNFSRTGDLASGPFFLLFSAPGVMLLALGLAQRKRTQLEHSAD